MVVHESYPSTITNIAPRSAMHKNVQSASVAAEVIASESHVAKRSATLRIVVTVLRNSHSDTCIFLHATPGDARASTILGQAVTAVVSLDGEVSSRNAFATVRYTRGVPKEKDVVVLTLECIEVSHGFGVLVMRGTVPKREARVVRVEHVV